MPGLDTLRGLAVLGVVCQHSFKLDAPPAIALTRTAKLIVALASPGWLGVTLFFILSGFLITGILLDTRTRENYWRSFYVRRALRILPLYLASMLFIHFTFHADWFYLGLCILFLANLLENTKIHTYGPYWSLAVEEQFYLVWPYLVRKLRPRNLAIVCLASIALSPWLRLLTGYLPLGDPYDATWLITDGLSLGAFFAIFLRSRQATLRNIRRLTIALAGTGFILLFICARFNMLSRSNISGRAFQTEPFLFLFGALLLLSLMFGDHPWVLRLTAPLRFYGYISFGVYLFNLAGFDLYKHRWEERFPPLQLLTAPILLGRFAFILTIITLFCFLSRRYFEDFFLRLKDRLVPYKSRTKITS